MKVKWLGHASFIIRAGGMGIYIDPYAGDYSEMADVVLVSHGHGDHCDLEKLALIRGPDTVILTSADCAEKIPPGNVETMSPGDVREFDGVRVHAVEAFNFKRFRSPGVPFHPEGTQVAYGQPQEGMVVITVDEAVRAKAYELLAKMEER